MEAYAGFLCFVLGGTGVGTAVAAWWVCTREREPGPTWRSLVWMSRVYVGVALIVAFGYDWPLFEPYHALSAELFFAGEIPPAAHAFGRLAFVLVGLTFGAHFLVLEWAARTGQRWAPRVVLISVLAWFVIDTGGSLGYGAWHNALVNVSALTAVLVAWALSRRQAAGARVLG